MDMIKSFLLVMSICYSSTFIIDRDVLDSTHGYSQCSGFDRTTGWWSTCTCKDEFTTMMSDNNTEYDCNTPEEIGCDYNLQEDEQAYLITHGTVNEALIPNVTQNNFTIQQIYFWSYNLYVGIWVDITNEAAGKFAIKHQDKAFLSISNLDLGKWGGHVGKIKFNDGTCLVFKVKGSIKHPFDVQALKQLLGGTKVPTTRSTMSTRPKTDATTTKIKTLPGQHIVSTTLLPSKQRGDKNHSQSSIIITIIAVVIAIALILAILFIYKRRRRASKQAFEHEVTEVKGKYPDASNENNAYESDSPPCSYNKSKEEAKVGGTPLDTHADFIVTKTGTDNPTYDCVS